jgi:hypothetical protein
MLVVTVVILITAKRKLTETAISTSVETYLLLRSSTQSEMHKHRAHYHFLPLICILQSGKLSVLLLLLLGAFQKCFWLEKNQIDAFFSAF